jgi:hypothetical protein
VQKVPNGTRGKLKLYLNLAGQTLVLQFRGLTSTLQLFSLSAFQKTQHRAPNLSDLKKSYQSNHARRGHR